MSGEKKSNYNKKNMKKLTGWHLITQLFCICLGPLVFAYFITSRGGVIAMAISLTIGYAVNIYCAGYKLATADSKVYSGINPIWYSCLISSIPVLSITLIFAILRLLGNYTALGDIDAYTAITHWFLAFWNFSFQGFSGYFIVTPTAFYWVLSFLVLPVSSTLGYIAGMNRFELSEKVFGKLVYKDKKQK